MSSDFIDVERWDPEQGRFVKSSPEEMMSEQDAVERVLEERVYEVVGREGHGTEWHCHECLQWSNQSRESVEHYRYCPIGLLEASQQENERLIAHGANLEDWILNAPEAVVNPSEDWCDGYAKWRSGAADAALEGQW